MVGWPAGVSLDARRWTVPQRQPSSVPSAPLRQRERMAVDCRAGGSTESRPPWGGLEMQETRRAAQPSSFAPHSTPLQQTG